MNYTPTQFLALQYVTTKILFLQIENSREGEE